MPPRELTRDRARQLRQSMTLPEVLLWQQLRGRRLEGLKFRRQHPIGPWILDFFHAASRTAVEIDGDWAHASGSRPAIDIRRDAWLADCGIRVVRIPAQAVLAGMGSVLDHILEEIPPSNSSPHLGEVDRLLAAGETEGVGTQTVQAADARRGSGSAG
jgi:very-short-patch-repair endonuclease